MLYALNSNNIKIEPCPNEKGFCPGCGEALRAKALTSRHVAPHWAHKAGDCDPWYEPETGRHREWKERFPVECREVSMGPHRADVRMRNGLILELQHSSISSEEIEDRERFYGDMIWLLDARDWALRAIDNQGYPRSAHAMEWSHLEEFNFLWLWPKRTWSVSQRHVVLDLGSFLVQVLDWRWGKDVWARGKAYGLEFLR